MGAPSFIDKYKRAIRALKERPHYQGFRQRELRYLGIEREERGDLHANVM